MIEQKRLQSHPPICTGPEEQKEKINGLETVLVLQTRAGVGFLDHGSAVGLQAPGPGGDAVHHAGFQTQIQEVCWCCCIGGVIHNEACTADGIGVGVAQHFNPVPATTVVSVALGQDGVVRGIVI